MKKIIKQFLEFNGRTISYKDDEGQIWIAIKPICGALNVNFDTQFVNIKIDPILSKKECLQRVTAADNKKREMVCLPEFYIYIWILQIQSNSKELLEYKHECAQILYDHFKGSIKGNLN